MLEGGSSKPEPVPTRMTPVIWSPVLTARTPVQNGQMLSTLAPVGRTSPVAVVRGLHPSGALVQASNCCGGGKCSPLLQARRIPSPPARGGCGVVTAVVAPFAGAAATVSTARGGEGGGRCGRAAGSTAAPAESLAVASTSGPVASSRRGAGLLTLGQPVQRSPLQSMRGSAATEATGAGVSMCSKAQAPQQSQDQRQFQSSLTSGSFLPPRRNTQVCVPPPAVLSRSNTSRSAHAISPDQNDPSTSPPPCLQTRNVLRSSTPMLSAVQSLQPSLPVQRRNSATLQNSTPPEHPHSARGAGKDSAPVLRSSASQTHSLMPAEVGSALKLGIQDAAESQAGKSAAPAQLNARLKPQSRHSKPAHEDQDQAASQAIRQESWTSSGTPVLTAPGAQVQGRRSPWMNSRSLVHLHSERVSMAPTRSTSVERQRSQVDTPRSYTPFASKSPWPTSRSVCTLHPSRPVSQVASAPPPRCSDTAGRTASSSRTARSDRDRQQRQTTSDPQRSRSARAERSASTEPLAGLADQGATPSMKGRPVLSASGSMLPTGRAGSPDKSQQGCNDWPAEHDPHLCSGLSRNKGGSFAVPNASPITLGLPPPEAVPKRFYSAPPSAHQPPHPSQAPAQSSEAAVLVPVAQAVGSGVLASGATPETMAVRQADLMHQMLLSALLSIEQESSHRLTVVRLGHGRYEIDGRRVRLCWGCRGGQRSSARRKGHSNLGSLASPRSPRDRPGDPHPDLAAELVVREDEVPDSGALGAEMTLLAYLRHCRDINAAATFRGSVPGTPAMARIPQDLRLTFKGFSPVDSSGSDSGESNSGIDSDLPHRCASMRKACAEARAREKAAEALSCKRPVRLTSVASAVTMRRMPPR